MDKRERWVKDSAYYIRGIIWANSNVLWTYKFTGNILDYNKQNSAESHQY